MHKPGLTKIKRNFLIRPDDPTGRVPFFFRGGGNRDELNGDCWKDLKNSQSNMCLLARNSWMLWILVADALAQ